MLQKLYPSQATQDNAEPPTQDTAEQHTQSSAEQHTQSSVEQYTQASAEQPAEKKMNKKHGRSVGSKPERKQRRSVSSKSARNCGCHTAAVSQRRPTLDLLEQSLQVLLRRVFFLNTEKSKYVSVGFYPPRFYYALIEFGGVLLLPVIIIDQHLTTLSEHLPELCAAMCLGERYTFRDGVFRLLYRGGNRAVA
jgi:hypothetical protein